MKGRQTVKPAILALVGVLFVLASSGPSFLTPPRQTPVDRSDPALDSIVPDNAVLEKVAGGFGFTEGPVWTPLGDLLFSDINAARINKLDSAGKVSPFMGPAEFTETDPAIAGVPGANGDTLDKDGRLTICDQGHRVVSRVEKDGRMTVLASRFEGKRFNSPNDLVYKSDGSLYFTDPPYGLEKEDNDSKKELSVNGVYRLAGGKLTLVVKDLPRPNGLAFSPNEKYIYIDNSEPKKLFMRYPVNPDGTLGLGIVFHDVSDFSPPGVPDGLKVDEKGNVYGTGPGGIWIFSPEGKHLGTIRVPEVAANCAWGGTDGRTLYITATTGLYRIHLLVPGIRP
jgi:gluconolactonase